MKECADDWSMTYATTFRRWMESVSFVVDVLDETAPVFKEEQKKEPPKQEEEKAPRKRPANRPRLKLDEEKVISLYNSGMEVNKIAKEMNCSIAPIRRILVPLYGDEKGHLRRGYGRPKLDRGKISALHNAGWDEKKIADEMGCEPETVKDILRELREAKATNEVSEC